MGLFKRFLGICATQLPVNSSCFTLEDGTLIVDLEKAVELAEVGGALRLEGDSLPVRLLVVHTKENTYVAFQNKCTHGGRRLDHKSDEQVVECCSVGKSRFDYSGNLKGGSAKRSIKTYPVEASGRQLRIQLDHP
jgi:nitrite reductase/ring-hydroxylating ferredoxin subunit